MKKKEPNLNMSDEEVDEYLNHLPLDPDRPMLEQLEEAALALGDQGLKWLQKHFYRDPEALSVLTSFRLGRSTKIKL